MLEEKCYGNKKNKSKAREMGGGETADHRQAVCVAGMCDFSSEE